MNDTSSAHNPFAAIAVVVHDIRPDWDMPGITHAVAAAFLRPDVTDTAVLAHAALRAAEDNRNRTPAVIPLDGAHWRPATPPTERPTPTPRNPPRCGHCSRLVTEPWEDHGEHCGQPLDAVPAHVRARLNAGLERARERRESAETDRNRSGVSA